MTEASKYLVGLARRNALAYTELPQACAAMLSGSAAEGESDAYSDIDMMIYYEELPSDEELERARLRNQGGERLWQLGTRENGAMMEAYPVAGVECQIVHVTIAAWERDMATVLDEHQVESPLQKALSGTLNGLPLYGEEWIAKWKARASEYPEALREKMVAHYLKFFPIWGMEERFFARDAVLWFHQIRVETLQNIFGVLAGLNRVYYTTFQFKRTTAFVKQLPIRPDNLEARLDQALAAPPHEAVVLLEELVRETLDLVEREMPQFDTTATRRRIELRLEPWHMAML
jgi:hypothetical protein